VLAELPARWLAVPPAVRPRGGAGRALVNARLTELTVPPDPVRIEPYRQALVAHVYEVEEVLQGQVSGTRVLVAMWGIRDGQVLPLGRKEGDRLELAIEPMSAHPELRSQRCIESTTDLDLDKYVETAARPL
ncbi:MAG: hypothetical protein AAB403_21155, partial [Planctomycetota bacterium]